jgi:transposase
VAGIAIAAIDPFRGYSTGLRRQLPDTTIVLDHFHAVALANRPIDDVR